LAFGMRITVPEDRSVRKHHRLASLTGSEMDLDRSVAILENYSRAIASLVGPSSTAGNRIVVSRLCWWRAPAGFFRSGPVPALGESHFADFCPSPC
jgi:hypothetical protein